MKITRPVYFNMILLSGVSSSLILVRGFRVGSLAANVVVSVGSSLLGVSKHAYSKCALVVFTSIPFW